MKKSIFTALLFVPVIWLHMYAEDDVTLSLPEVTIGGYIQAGYTAVQNDVSVSTDTFNIRRARLSLSFEVFPAVSGYMMASMKNGDIQDAYVTYAAVPWLSVRLGKQGIPLSDEGTLDEARLDFIEYSEVVDELVVQLPGQSDVGVLVASEGAFWSSSIMVSNGTETSLEDTDEHKAYSGRLVFIKEHVRIGGSGYRTRRHNALLSKRESIIRYAGEIRMGDENGFLKAEYLFGKDGSIKKDGWSVAGDAGLPFISPWLYRSIPVRVLVRFVQWDPDKDTRDDKESHITFGLAYLVSEHVRADMNYTIIQEETKTQIPNNRFAAQVQLKF